MSYKVIQWSTGNVGKRVIRALSRRDDLALAAVLVVSEDEDSMERAYAQTDLDTAAGTVRSGTIAGQHYKWAGMHRGHEAVVHETFWRMHESVSPDWPDGRHSAEIRGEGNMKIEFDWSFLGEDILLSTGMHALNAIPAVCAAEPGIQTLLDLPWIMGKGAYRRP